jgi:NitT/TauT family transport system ATP-binding protein
VEIGVTGIGKSFGEKVVLKDVSFSLPEGKVSAIMAPSGRGKTTLLRILMGLEEAKEGEVFGFSDVKKGVVFQEDRLCENLTPIANIRLVNPGLTKEEVRSALHKVGLFNCEEQKVKNLSGGMKRRVAILRALLSDCDILIFDEPFRGLDADTKLLVLEDTKMRLRGRTTVLVTHEEEEAKALGAVQVIHL